MLEAYENRLPGEKLSLIVSLPFLSVHVGALFALTIYPSAFALFMVFLMYFIRMFGITAGFPRFFSHKTFKTSRTFQFIIGLFLYNEPFDTYRLIGFILIWVAVLIYVFDLYEKN